MTQADTLVHSFDNSNPHIKRFIRQIQNPVLQRLFMFAKLPSAFFMGVKIQSVSPKEAKVSIPYKWRSQNPFKSIYFAAQAAAAPQLQATAFCALAPQSARRDASAAARTSRARRWRHRHQA